MVADFLTKVMDHTHTDVIHHSPTATGKEKLVQDIRHVLSKDTGKDTYCIM